LRALIIANGQLREHKAFTATLQKGDLLIAADGGGRHFLDLSITPDIVVGDMDSLHPEELEALTAQGAHIIEHARRKDETDLELAVHEAIRAGAKDILIFGALGKRWDMTLANVLLPADTAFRGTRISLIDGHQRVMLLQPGETHRLKGSPGDTLSLIPLAGDVTGITTHNLEYPLSQESLHVGSPRGVSNVFQAETVSIHMESGLLLCVHIGSSYPHSGPASKK